MPHRRTVQIWNTFTNQRVTLDAEIPSIPVNQLPVYQGKSPSSTLNVSFTDSNESHNSNYTGEICFLVVNNKIAESKFNLADNATELKPMEMASFQTTGLNDSGKYIIQQIRIRNFVTQKGNIPMFSLGRIRITEVEFVYFNSFDTYSYRYKGQTTYYPAWKITAETSNYGNEVLMVKAV
ncbi:hypothetical protein MSHOH_0059 [Methanosarcina horonobensis HB-1 = JCM 15518]|uniref:Uncharacterized protein n=1 Tax=Methanosarcina horonobensis HB-1 = JCM 15518 TaxID=1434110 RepID=A0A0E3SA67_9EURY|nr:hypothetical protein [Methanosarcina horonobensis]AKB76542.1 hypothetical protein MSHOH_0059 [Methanosarcina horonobensis HB-1 = JCM 15518]